MIVLNSLSELRRFTYAMQSTRVDGPKHVDVVIPCRSDRAMVRVGRKTVKDDLSISDVAKIMRLLTPAHSKRG